MDYFNYNNTTLYAEDVSVKDIVDNFNTPCYVYSKKTILRHFKAFDDALATQPHLICYAVKANSNLSILKLLADAGAGFDVVSKGELQRVLHIGADPNKIVFSGVGKTIEEIEFAIEKKIHCINVESIPELERIQQISQQHNVRTPVSLRINPNIDPKTHPYISTGLKENKFGIAFEEAIKIYKEHHHYPHLNFIGIDCHIGSQITQLAPFIEALDKLLSLADELNQHAGLNIEHLDLGGGLGVPYNGETPPEPHELATALKNKLASRQYKIILEPGRAIMANAGILLTKVEYIKKHHDKNFIIVDAAMNDLLRPALYQAFHNIIPAEINHECPKLTGDVVGGVCETGDFLGQDRTLAVQAGDVLAIRSCGAYGASMSSNYNSRPKLAEIMIDGNLMKLIQRRESFEDMIKNESYL